jgi:hypothetical protein
MLRLPIVAATGVAPAKQHRAAQKLCPAAHAGVSAPAARQAPSAARGSSVVAAAYAGVLRGSIDDSGSLQGSSDPLMRSSMDFSFEPGHVYTIHSPFELEVRAARPDGAPHCGSNRCRKAAPRSAQTRARRPQTFVAAHPDQLVVLMCKARACRPCKAFSRKYHHIAEKFTSVIVLDILGDESMDTRKMMMDMQIKSTPTFKMYKGGQVRARGAASAAAPGCGATALALPPPRARPTRPEINRPHPAALTLSPPCSAAQEVETTTGINDAKLKAAMRSHMAPHEPAFEPDEAERAQEAAGAAH